jgi:hypothetical protein
MDMKNGQNDRVSIINGFLDTENNNDLLYWDLRPFQDEVRVLRNPHKGWYWHYVDNGLGRTAYREPEYADPEDMLRDFPGLNHLYLRLDWADIEPEEGQFDWSFVDKTFEKWGSAGYRFSFRLCTFEGGVIPYATPKWVFDAGAEAVFTHDAWEPDYGDPVYLNKLSVFMEEFGRRYNGHPLVEYVDVGTYGTWGEGHAYAGSAGQWRLDTVKKHLDMHAANFPDTFVLLNDDHVNYLAEYDQKGSAELVRYARRLGFGLRDDSVCVRSYAEKYGYSTLRTPHLFSRFYDQAPIDLELEHYHAILPKHFKDGFPYLDAMVRTRCTFAGFHGYPRPWLKMAPWFTDYAANRLGYWYFIEGVELPPMYAGRKNVLTLRFSNRGFSRCYFRYTAKILLRGKKDIVIPLNLDNRRWFPGEPIVEHTSLDLHNVDPGRYQIAFGLFEGERPIEFGVQESRLINSFALLGEIDIIH